MPGGGLEIDGFGYALGGYSAFRGFPTSLMRPPVVKPGTTVTFTNLDALPTMPDDASRSGTASPPAGRPATAAPGSAIRSPAGPINFDSGQLGFGTGLSAKVTTGSNVYTTPPLTKPGKTYTYFCRIHPFMRGSIRVAGGKPRRR